MSILDRADHVEVPVHLEMSFKNSPPATQLFYAARVEHRQGGETPLRAGCKLLRA